MRKHGVTWARLAGVTLAVLFFAAASGSGDWSLSLHQLWVLRRTLFWIGLGVLVVFTVGEHLNRWALKAIERLDGWMLQGRNRASFLLAALIFTYTVLWCAASFLRHYSFNSGSDLGNQDQVVWNTAQGRLFARSMEVTNDLGDHVRPYLAVLSLAYLILPSPYVLLAFQSLVLALSAWPLYRLSQRKFNSPTIGLSIAFCALAYPPLGFVNRFDFHSEVIAFPLLIAAYERVDANDFKNAAFFLGLALLGKENIGLTVAALGLTAAVYHRLWRFGSLWIFVGLAYSLTALFVVIPAFRGAPSDTLVRYQWLGDTPLDMLWTIVSDPVLVLKKLLVAQHFLTLLQLLAPLAFLPLLSPSLLVPVLPALFYNFMSQWPSQTTIYLHYMGPVIPFMGVAAALGLHTLTRCTREGWLRSGPAVGLGVSVMLLATLASWTYENPATRNPRLSGAAFRQRGQTGEKASPLMQRNDAAIREGLKNVPDGVYLLTTVNYIPHLSHRPQIGRLRRAPVATLEPGVEAIFLNLRDFRNLSCDDSVANLNVAARSGFGVTFYRDGVLLVQKGEGDFGQLKDLLEDLPGCE